jgi:crotonobetainyl-CoA:carnitine CoA-transferase CaiB-like acyl-CoA transferase
VTLPSKTAAAGTVPHLRAPMLFDGEPLRVERAAPALGEDSDTVLGGLLGLGENEIAALRDKGVVG